MSSLEINTISDFRKAVRHGRYAWPGGYPTFFLCEDGDALCHDCATFHRRDLISAIGQGRDNGWRVAGLVINYEDTELQCDHCHASIESAYGD